MVFMGSIAAFLLVRCRGSINFLGCSRAVGNEISPIPRSYRLRHLSQEGEEPGGQRLLVLAQTLLLLVALFVTGCTTTSTAPAYKEKKGYGRQDFKTANPSSQDRPVTGADPTPIIRQRVVWLGVASTVVDAEVGSRFPILSLAVDGGDGASRAFAELNQRIWATLSNHLGAAGKFPGFELVEAGADRGSDLGMALLVNKERWREEVTFEGKSRREYGVLAQLVFIDQKKMELVASYPIGNRATMIAESKASDAEKVLMSRETLYGGTGGGGHDSLLHQLLKTMEGSSVRVSPDYCMDVGNVSFREACLHPSYSGSRREQIKKMDVDPEQLAVWASEAGSILVNHLGNDTGYAFNPFVARKSGKDNLISLNFLRGSPIVLNQKGPLSLRLRDPIRSFDLQIDGLSCEIDEEFTGKYVVNLIYGFRGMMIMRSADGVEVFKHPFDVSLAGIKSFRKDLRETYWQKSRRKLLPAQFEEGAYDPRWNWQNSLDNFLDQLALEMFFPKADAAGRFNTLRANLGGIHAAIR